MLKLLKKRWYVLVILFIFIGGFFFYQKNAAAQKNKLQEYVVARESLKEILSLPGKIDAEEKATLQFQSAGRLTWVGVKEGDAVKKYQGIASLDQRELQKSLERYLNTYMKVRWDFDQSNDDNHRMVSEGMTEQLRNRADRLIDKAQFDLNNSVIDVELQALAKEYAYLYTPIEGIVTKVDTPQAGVNIIPSSSKFEIINPNTIYFSASADQTEVIHIQEGKTAELSFDPYPDKIFRGYVEKIAYTPKEGETGTVYAITIKFTQEGDVYRLGMTGDASFVLQEKQNVIVVPSQYIKTEGSEKTVEKKVGTERKKVTVRTGAEIEGVVEILDGLQEGDVIYETTN